MTVKELITELEKLPPNIELTVDNCDHQLDNDTLAESIEKLETKMSVLLEENSRLRKEAENKAVTEYYTYLVALEADIPANPPKIP